MNGIWRTEEFIPRGYTGMPMFENGSFYPCMHIGFCGGEAPSVFVVLPSPGGPTVVTLNKLQEWVEAEFSKIREGKTREQESIRLLLGWMVRKNVPPDLIRKLVGYVLSEDLNRIPPVLSEWGRTIL